VPSSPAAGSVRLEVFPTHHALAAGIVTLHGRKETAARQTSIVGFIVFVSSFAMMT
jgi:hypothetical protein